ncbi:general secretion pathway protein G [Yoonia maricola]|uniref:Type II secretion system core protein G n=1 Tax=Yoonia maricola TaxID=420999 RepID=A0A2M8W1W8_9RHOB|nr:type II secretion system major pseudopilin GspG [Yoonia maricola]PJI84923.1 general secretion pathway protein G [Yoonia maricola]
MRFSQPLLLSTRSPSRRRAASSGFSLIEMLVAVAIIGLIVGLVGPAAMRQLQSSRVNTTEAQIGQIRTAIDIFAIDTGRIPSESEGLSALVTNTSAIPGWNGPYLRDGTLPMDAWSRDFLYVVEEGQVRVVSLGADGQAGGTGNDADIGR